MTAAITTRANGKAEMAYVGGKPWHGLGQELPAGADIDTWLVAAGMDWRIQRGVVRYATDRDGGGMRTADDLHVFFRSDTKAHLGFGSPSFKMVQPRDVLEFFRDLVDGQGFALNTAGTLHDGKRFWALARVEDDAVVVGKDRVGGHLLLATSCDRSMPTIAKFVAERVVCQNTLSIALGENGEEVRVKHRTTFDADAAKKQLGIARGAFREFLTQARRLSEVRVADETARDVVRSLLVDQGVSAEDKVDESRPLAKILGLFGGAAIGDGLEGVHGTAWGLLNAVTEYTDHHARASSDSHRMTSAWFGNGDKFKTAALEKVLVLAS